MFAIGRTITNPQAAQIAGGAQVPWVVMRLAAPLDRQEVPERPVGGAAGARVEPLAGPLAVGLKEAPERHKRPQEAT